MAWKSHGCIVTIRRWSLFMAKNSWHNGCCHQGTFRHGLCIIRIVFSSQNPNLLQYQMVLRKTLLINTGFWVNGHCLCSVTVFLISGAEIQVCLFIQSFSNSLNIFLVRGCIFYPCKVIDGSDFFYIYINYGCLMLDTGMSQPHFGALELSQSQDFESDFVPNEGDVRHQFHPGAAVPSSRLVKNDTKDGMWKWSYMSISCSVNSLWFL